MKAKIFNFITVFFVTLGVIAPALLVFGLILERHMELVNTQHLVYEVKKSSEGEIAFAPKQEATDSYKQTELLKSFNGQFVGQLLIPAQPETIVNSLVGFIFFVPIGFCLGMSLSDRYRVYRAAVFKERVEMLERLWQQSIHS
jgi:hypothetical protein